MECNNLPPEHISFRSGVLPMRHTYFQQFVGCASLGELWQAFLFGILQIIEPNSSRWTWWHRSILSPIVSTSRLILSVWLEIWQWSQILWNFGRSKNTNLWENLIFDINTFPSIIRYQSDALIGPMKMVSVSRARTNTLLLYRRRWVLVIFREAQAATTSARELSVVKNERRKNVWDTLKTWGARKMQKIWGLKVRFLVDGFGFRGWGWARRRWLNGLPDCWWKASFMPNISFELPSGLILESRSLYFLKLNQRRKRARNSASCRRRTELSWKLQAHSCHSLGGLQIVLQLPSVVDMDPDEVPMQERVSCRPMCRKYINPSEMSLEKAQESVWNGLGYLFRIRFRPGLVLVAWLHRAFVVAVCLKDLNTLGREAVYPIRAQKRTQVNLHSM